MEILIIYIVQLPMALKDGYIPILSTFSNHFPLEEYAILII